MSRAVSNTSLTGFNIIWYACDERKLFFPFRFEGCLSFFQKIRICLKIDPKNIASKIKPIISSCFLYIWETFFKKLLKELRNCILCIVSVWSLFCSVRVYISLHFLPILW